MQSGPTIKQRIQLEGADEIRKQLSEMGAAGEAAIKAIDRAVAANNSTLGVFARGVANVRARFDEMGKALEPAHAAITRVGEAVGEFRNRLGETADKVVPHFREVLALTTAGAAAGFVEIIKSAADRLHELEINSQKLGLTTQEFQRLTGAAKMFGITEDELITRMGRFGREVEQTQKQLNESAIKIGQIVSGKDLIGSVAVLRGASDETKKFRGHVVDLSDAFNPKLMEAIKFAFQKMQEAGAAGGKTLASFTGDVLAKLQKGGGEAASLREELNKMNVSTSGETVFDRLQKSVPGFLTSLQRAGIELKDFAGNQKSPLQLLGEYANWFARLPTYTEKAAEAQKMFGRGGQAFIPMLNQGAAGLQRYAAYWRQLGVEVPEINEHMIEAGVKFRVTVSMFEDALTKLKVMFAVGFMPAVEPAITELTKLMLQNGHAVEEWSHSVGESVRSVVVDLVTLAREGGDSQNIKNSWIRDLVPVFRDIAAGAKLAYVVIKGAFDALAFVLEPVAAALNAAFGTHFTGTILAAGVVILQLVGFFGVLSAAISVVMAVLGAIAAIITSPWLLMAAAIVAVVTVVYNFRDQIAAFFTWLAWRIDIAATNFQQGFYDAITTIKGYFTGLRDWAWGILEAIGAKAKAALSFLGLTGGGGDGEATAPIPPAEGHATGGMIRGPGGVDRVPGWLTAGEYVMRTSAVEKYGLSFMHALNAGLLPALRFNIGGLVPSARPALAMPGGSGSSSGRSAFTIVLDGRSFDASADREVADSLLRTAKSSQMKSTGRKPGWFGG